MASKDTRRLRVIITSDSQELEKDLHDVQTEADKTGTKLNQLSAKTALYAEAAERAASKSRKLTDAFKNAGFEKQVAQIAALEAKVKKMKLHVGLDVDVDKKGKSFKKLLSAGQEIGSNLAEQAGQAFSKFPQFAAATIPIVAPILGAGIAAAIVGGSGFLGVAGGIALAAKDQRVKDAASKLSGDIGAQLQKAASPFIPAILKQFGKVPALMKSLDGDIRGIFSKSAGFLDPLFEGFAGFARQVVPGIRKAVESAGPFFDAMKVSLPRIGLALRQLFETAAKHGPEIGVFVLMISSMIEKVINLTSSAVDGLTSMFGWLIRAAKNTNDFMVKAFSWVPGLKGMLEENKKKTDEWAAALTNTGDSAQGAGTSTNFFATMTKAAGDKAKEASDKAQEWFSKLQETANKAIAAANANIGFQQAVDDASAALKRNGATLDINSQKGRDNKSSLISLAERVNALSQSVLTETGSQTKATAATEKGRQKFIALADKMGLSKDQAIKLANKLIPLDKTYTTGIKTSGYAKTQSQLDNLLIRQQALNNGISISAAGSAFRKNASGMGDGLGVTKRFGDGIGANWPFPTTTKRTKIPSWDDVSSKVSGSGWKYMQRLIGGAFPGLHMISGFRPGARTLSGNLSYHALGRAVDYPPVKRLAKWIHDNFGARIKELITPWQQYNLLNGRKHRYSGAVWNQHNFAGGNAHVHWAMDGITTLEPGLNVGVNRTGKRETVVNKDLLNSGPVFNIENLNLNGVQNVKQIRDELLKLAKRNGGRVVGTDIRIDNKRI